MRGREQDLVIRGVANMFLLAPFTVLLKTVSNKPAHLPKKMAIACVAKFTTLKKQRSAPSQPAKEESDVDLVYKPGESKEPLMRKHTHVKRDGERRFEQDRLDEVKIVDAFIEFKKEFIEMLFKFESKRHGHFDRVNIAKHRVNLVPGDAKPIQSAS